VAEKVRRLERRGLETLLEGVAVLQGDAQQVAGAPDGARCRLEQPQPVGVLLRVGEWRELAFELVVRADLLPYRPHDVHHLPVRHPLAARPRELLALTASLAPPHAC